MKKILISLFTLVFCLCLVGCDKITQKEATLTFNYDYGNHIDGKITPLFDYSFLDFDIEEPVKELIPGDQLIIKYRGKMYCKETYPGRKVLLENSKIISSKYIYTSVRYINEEQIERNESNGISKINNYIYTTEYVIINEQLDYIPLSEYTGSILYASSDLSKVASCPIGADCEPSPLYASAFFAYNPREKEKTYELTIQNETDYELVGIKEGYKAGEEVEVKMFNEVTVLTFVHLNGELLGTLNGLDSLKFNMPKNDSVLVITYTEKIYRINAIDNFNLLIVPLKQYYAPGDTVQVITRFLSGPRIDVQVDGQFLEVKKIEALNYYGYEFVMPKKDVEVIILYNNFINYPCENNEHQWNEGIEIETGEGAYVMEYTCQLCGNKMRETITIISPLACPYKWSKTEYGHSMIMLCDCCDTPAVEKPHEDSNSDSVCDICGYVFDTTGINGFYHPKLIAASLVVFYNNGIVKEVLEDFSLWIQNDTLYLNSRIFANGKIGEIILGKSKYLSKYNLDKFHYVNDEARDLVKVLLSQETYYSIAVESYPEMVPGHCLIELNGDVYYIYTLFTLGVSGSSNDVLVFKLNN